MIRGKQNFAKVTPRANFIINLLLNLLNFSVSQAISAHWGKGCAFMEQSSSQKE